MSHLLKPKRGDAPDCSRASALWGIVRGMVQPGSGLGVELGNTSSAPRRGEKGATLVEFAVVAPLLFLLLFGVIEFGRAIATYTAVTTAAREAARYATTTVGDTGIPPFRDCDGIRDKAFAKTPLVDRSQSSVSIAYNDGAGNMVIDMCPEGGTGPELLPGDRISVQVETTFRSPIPLISNLVGDLEVSSIQRRTVYPSS